MAKVGLFKVLMPALPADVDQASNQFVFESDTAVDFSAITPVCTHVSNFYTAIGTGGVHPVGYYLSGALDHGANHCSVEVYDITTHLDGSAHGSPVAITNFTLPATGDGQQLPEEVAVTMSYRANYGTDVEFAPGARPRARDRNRTYIGPLNFAILGTTGLTGRSQVKAAAITDILAGLFTLSGTISDGTNNWNMRVWSRKNAALKLPTIGWMDDVFDSQRRRRDPSQNPKTSRSLASV